jgi:multisubunit Na+/H+ antiporter MnhE subunit
MTMFTELTNFILGAGLNLAVALIIVRFIYYPFTQNKNYVFTFLAFSTIVYFVLGLFTSTDLSVGVGFGLFAIFSVLRYRTDEMPIREMTYLFIIIALPVMNSILMSNGDVMKLLAANGMIVALLYILEKEWGFHFEASKKITYEKIDLITPANRDYLLADLRQRTGLPIKRVEVGRLNFLRDTAELKIFYDEPQLATPAIRPQTESKNSRQHQQPILKL